MTGHSLSRIVLALSIALLAPAAGGARVWVVAPDGLGDAPTIAAAIDSMSGGDVIELLDGTFTGPGNRDMNNQEKAVVIRSRNGDPAACVIDCEGTPDDPHHGIRFFGGG